jgi:uncharacterized membrane protein YbaN (DUF454 family)
VVPDRANGHDGRVASIVDTTRRAAWTVAGLVAVGIGAVGIVVPGLPTTVFFIIAAWCFARSNPRLEAWVLGLPRIGPAVARYRAGLGMPLAAKRWAVASIVGFSSLSVWVLDPAALRITIAVVAAIGVWYVWSRVPTTPTEVDDELTAR